MLIIRTNLDGSDIVGFVLVSFITILIFHKISWRIRFTKLNINEQSVLYLSLTNLFCTSLYLYLFPSERRNYPKLFSQTEAQFSIITLFNPTR